MSNEAIWITIIGVVLLSSLWVIAILLADLYAEKKYVDKKLLQIQRELFDNNFEIKQLLQLIYKRKNNE